MAKQSTSGTLASSDEDLPFAAMLKSMGVEDFDPLVPAALNEYATRFLSELLSDAKDYSLHAEKEEIDPDDIKAAVKLSDVHITGIDPQESIVDSFRAAINCKGLVDLADPRAVQQHYPIDMFLQRTHSFVPGPEAYPEPSESEEDGIALAETGAVVEQKTAKEPTGNEMEIEGQVNQENAAVSSGSTGVKFTPAGAKQGPKLLDPVPGFSGV